MQKRHNNSLWMHYGCKCMKENNEIRKQKKNVIKKIIEHTLIIKHKKKFKKFLLFFRRKWVTHRPVHVNVTPRGRTCRHWRGATSALTGRKTAWSRPTRMRHASNFDHQWYQSTPFDVLMPLLVSIFGKKIQK